MKVLHILLNQDLVQKTGRMVSQWIYLGGVKAFFDGSLGSNSALFYEVSMQKEVNIYVYTEIGHFGLHECLGVGHQI